MSNLVIIDVSPMIHFGNTSKYYRDRTYYGYPVGGINYLMREVTIAIAKRDHVLLCFDSPSFRIDLMPKYKAGRVKNAAVISQIETVFEGLSACGFRCEKYDGYEADDIIDWACQKYAGKYSQIDIVGNDYDLCHSVQNGIRFKSIDPGSSIVYYGNFEHAVVRGKTIRFNTISAYKVFAGCNSDKIPGMHLECGLSGYKLYGKFLEFVDAKYPSAPYKLLTDYRLPIDFAVNSGLFTDEEKQQLAKQVQLVYPARKPDDVDVQVTMSSDVNKEKLVEFLAMYNGKDSIMCLTNRRPSLTEVQKEEVRRKAKSLLSGEFAADIGAEPESKVQTHTLQLNAFTREF